MGWGTRPECNIPVWFSKIMVLLPKKQESVWREERDVFGFEVLVVQRVLQSKSDLEESLTKVQVRRDKSDSPQIRKVKGKKAYLQEILAFQNKKQNNNNNKKKTEEGKLLELKEVKEAKRNTF